MQANEVRKALIQVLEEIQNVQGLECPPIQGTTKPTEALPQFDSKIWPVVTGKLANVLGIPISADVNIFCREKSCVALTIDETVGVLMELIAAQATNLVTAGSAA